MKSNNLEINKLISLIHNMLRKTAKYFNSIKIPISIPEFHNLNPNNYPKEAITNPEEMLDYYK